VGKDRHALIDRSGQSEIVSLAATAIQQAF
jgi:hypothetical protein